MILDGRYELIDPLGKGAFSEVFRARGIVQGKEVALKLSLSSLSSGEAARMRHEFRTLTTLRHPHVLRTYDYGLTKDGRAFLSLELLEGVSLDQLVSGWNEDLARYALQALDALAYIHAEGYVHNDLKPTNLMVNGDRLVVMDFGFAEPQKKLASEVKGTLGYMAPEALKGAEVDGRADLYSLGVILYEKICGKRPFEEESGLGEIRKALSGSPEPLFVGDSKIPPAVNEFVLKLLARHPEERYSSASEAYKALAEALGLEEEIEVKPTTQKPKPGRFVGREREMSLLRDGITRAQEEKQNTLVYLVGSEGIGKTRLLLEFKFSCQLEHYPVFWISGEQEIRELLQKLSEVEGGGKAGVVVADDWDLWDKADQELLRSHVYDLWGHSLLWILASQSDESFALFAEDDFSQSTLNLGGLNPGETQTLATSILSLFPEIERFSRWVFEQTEGSPRKIEEVIRYLYEEGLLFPFGCAWRVEFERLPEAWAGSEDKRIVESRLARFSPEARRLLQHAAVIGVRFGGDALEAVSGEGYHEALQEVIEQGWVISALDSGGHYVFRVPSYQVKVYEDMLEEERKALHHETGKWLESQRANPEALAKHFILGGDLEKGLDYSIAVGEKAESQSSGGAKRAISYFEKAISLAVALNRTPVVRELCVRTGKLYNIAGEYTKALSLFKQAESILEESGNGELGVILHCQGKTHLHLGNLEKAKVLLEHALQLAGETVLKGQILKDLGVVIYNQGHYEEAKEYFFQAVPILARFSDRETSIAARAYIGNVFQEIGRTKEAKEIHYQVLGEAPPSKRPGLLSMLGLTYWREENLEKAHEVLLQGAGEAKVFGTEKDKMSILNNLGLVELNQNEWKQAIEHLEDALILARKSKDRLWMGLVENNLTWAYLHIGEFQRALTYGCKALANGRAVGDKKVIAGSHRFLGMVHQRLGNWVEAHRWFDEAVRILKDLGDKTALTNSYSYLGFLYCDEGRCEDAVLYFNKALELCAEEGDDKTSAGKALALAEIGEIEKAEELCSHALSRAKITKHDEWLGFCERAWGLILLKKRLIKESYQTFLNSATHFLAMRDSYEAARSQLRAVEAGLESVSQISLDEISALLSEAGELFERLSAAKDLARAKDLSFRVLVAHARDKEKSSAKQGMVEVLTKMTELLDILVSEDEVYARTLELLVILFGAERGVLFLKDPLEENLRLVHVYPSSLSQDQDTLSNARELSKTVSTSSARSALEEKEVIFTNEALSDDRFASRQSVILNRIQSLMCAPLRIGGDVIGTIYLDSRLGGALFVEGDQPFLKAVASVAAAAIEKAWECRKLQGEVQALKGEEGLPGMIGTSAPMLALYAKARKVAPSEATILIEGESGTGKEVLARAIHLLSKRKDKPFVPVDCGALPETLLESELFGHKKGSFTGAFADKLGLFEEAHGGTVFLDEIASASPGVQAKLLRFLQEGEIRRVGETKPRKVDVRVLCATNLDLEAEVIHKRFRRDLFYRLKVLSLMISPLRGRRVDVIILAEHFRKHYSTRMGKAVRGFRREALDVLLRAKWEGNVRELQHAVERAVILSQEPYIGLSDLEIPAPMPLEKVSFREVVESQKKFMVMEALEENGGNVARAAKSLGVNRVQFQKLMVRFRIKCTGKKGRPKSSI